MRLQVIYAYVRTRVYKLDLVLNNLQEIICHKTQPTNISYTNNYMVSSNYFYLVNHLFAHSYTVSNK